MSLCDISPAFCWRSVSLTDFKRPRTYRIPFFLSFLQRGIRARYPNVPFVELMGAMQVRNEPTAVVVEGHCSRIAQVTC